jgi:hypothetical protein
MAHEGRQRVDETYLRLSYNQEVTKHQPCRLLAANVAATLWVGEG